MKKLLLTGAAGFVGKNILPILSRSYEVATLGRGGENKIVADLSESVPDFDERFDVVVHAAGKAHCIPRTKEEVQAFFDVNLAGTQNLCFALEKSGMPKSFIFISTVAVYGRESGEDISENAPLAGTTPYAKSKIAAENFLQNWCAEHGVILTVLRPALIAGADAPGNLGTMVRGIKSGKYLRIGSGKARKSIVMVEDLARLVLLAEAKGGVFNACATEAPSFAELEKLIASQCGKKEPFAIPLWVAKIMARFGDCCFGKAPIDSSRLKKITETLTFSNAKARAELAWIPAEILENYRINTPPQLICLSRADFRGVCLSCGNVAAFPSRCAFLGKEAA